MTPSRYTQPFDNQTRITIPGTVHQLGTANLALVFFGPHDAGSWERIRGRHTHIDPVTYDVTVTFAVSETGVIVLTKR